MNYIECVGCDELYRVCLVYGLLLWGMSFQLFEIIL